MAGTYDMITGVTLLASACLGVVASALLSRLRDSNSLRRHRIFSIVMIFVCCAGVLAVMCDWASRINNFPATFGPFVLALNIVGVRKYRVDSHRRSVGRSSEP